MNPRILRSAICAVSLLALLLCGSACTALRYSGAPPPSYDVDADLKQLAEHFRPATEVSNFYNISSPVPKDRNVVISARMVMINLEYLKWLRKVNADKQSLDTATDVLIMSLNLAATATGGATAKTILSAISAGVSGSKASFDKHFFYEKTIPALVAAMNAQRKVVLTRILAGMNQSLDDYPFEQALADIYEYYQAGTFMGAIIVIQADSGAKEKQADEKIVKISTPTPDEKAAVKKLQPVWVELYNGAAAGTVPHASVLRDALKRLGETTVPVQDKDVLNRLHEMLQKRERSAVEILKALKDAGYPDL